MSFLSLVFGGFLVYFPCEDVLFLLSFFFPFFPGILGFGRNENLFLFGFFFLAVSPPPPQKKKKGKTENLVVHPDVHLHVQFIMGIVLGLNSYGPWAPSQGPLPRISSKSLAHRNRNEFCDLRLRCPSRTPEIAAKLETRQSNAALRFKGAMENR